jgi:hypothetical protein
VSMNKTANDVLRWIAVIGFLIVVPILVRASTNGGAIRIVCYGILLATITSWCAYIGFKPGSLVEDMPIANDLKTAKSKKMAELVFRGLPLIFFIGGFAMLAEFMPAVFMYASNRATAVTEVRL